MEKQTNVNAASSPRHSAQFLKQRRFYLVLPLLILPFTTMAFLALGGGKTVKSGQVPPQDKGIDLTMPSAQFKNDEAKDKMEIYRVTGKDSATSAGPTGTNFAQTMGFERNAGIKRDGATQGNMLSPSQSNADRQSAEIEAKLARINNQLQQPQPHYSDINYTPEHPETYKKINKLRNMMRDTKMENTPDPELQQLSKMVEQLQAIQNPQAIKPQAPVTSNDTLPFKAIPAIIDGKQKVVDGGEVRLKLTDTVSLKKILLPKGQLLYGPCQVTNQRLLLSIRNIRQGNRIIPVDLTVFSLDGLTGIPAHEAELSGTASGGANNTLSSMQFLSMDQSLGAQAAAGGIQTAKDIFGKKIRKIKVKLENQFPVLLRDNTKK